MTADHSKLLSAIERCAAEMQRLTTNLPTRFEVRASHLRLVTPGFPDGTRQGRNFPIYAAMARDTNTSLALTDFAGVLLRFMELCPDQFPSLLPHIIALGEHLEFEDERTNWTQVWSPE